MQILILMRIKQWVKNTFIFIPVFFAGELFDIDKIIPLSISFIAFSLVASAIYIVNDIRDVEKDRLHPEKCKRPIASGKIKETTGYVLATVLALVGLIIAYFTNQSFLAVLASYFVLNMGYSWGLKNIAILDLLIVASGFVLRIISGGCVADVPVSQWLILMVYLLALFLVLAKRREDIMEFETSGKIVRTSALNYNLDFIHSILTMLSAVILVSYLMYTLSEDVIQRFNSKYLYLTTVFVIAGVMRYIQITMVENKSGSPTNIFYTDRFLHLTMLGWVISFFAIIYILPS